MDNKKLYDLMIKNRLITDDFIKLIRDREVDLDKLQSILKYESITDGIEAQMHLYRESILSKIPLIFSIGDRETFEKFMGYSDETCLFLSFGLELLSQAKSDDDLKETFKKLDLGMHWSDSVYYAEVLGCINSDPSTLSNEKKWSLIAKINELCFKNCPKIIYPEEEKRLKSFRDKIYDTVRSKNIEPTEAHQDEIKNMMRNFFSNNNERTINVLKNFDFTKYGKCGLPLKYPKSEFLSDLRIILSKLPEEEKEKALGDMGIELVFEGDKIKSYNGIIDLSNIKNEEVYEIAHRFIRENEIQTEDEDANLVLNSLIQGMGEFLNTSSKIQGALHTYSLDCHILQVLQNAMNDPEFDKLDDIDKTALKFAIIMHDISKDEAMEDKNHPQKSSLYSKSILSKYNLPQDIKDRISYLIENHHWFTFYNTKEMSGDDIAALFRYKNDYEIMKIFSRADLKGVSNLFYYEFGRGLEDDEQKSVFDSLDRIKSFGQLIFTTRNLSPSKIPQIEYKGHTYRVLNFNEIDDEEDLSKYGFLPDTKKPDVRFFIHAAQYIENLEAACALAKSGHENYLSSSFISPENNSTFQYFSFGLGLESQNSDIASAYYENIASNEKKNYENFKNTITNKDPLKSYRFFLPRLIKDELNLTPEEYQELYKKISHKKYLSQIRDCDIFVLGKKKFNGAEIKSAILNAQDKLFRGREYNEVTLYKPKVTSFIAKVQDISEIPDEYLEFVRKHNLPVYIMKATK